MGEDHYFGDLTIADIEKLRSIVKRKSNRLLTREDREDIVSKILEDAVRGSRKTGTPLVKLAFTYSQYVSYYIRPLDNVMEHVRNQQPLVYDEQGDLSDESDAPDSRVDFTGPIVTDLLSRLPAAELSAFRSVLDGASVSEAAAETGISTSTTHDRIKRARASLRQLWLAA
ncbi:RNA polymerase sigma factor [Microbacterium sp. MMO-113]|uniref:RNA polymerase sigma factor n=1 Tax=Microbacterium sp. MMO-113 TaxID=3081273 RepID=UPI0030184ED4